MRKFYWIFLQDSYNILIMDNYSVRKYAVPYISQENLSCLLVTGRTARCEQQRLSDLWRIYAAIRQTKTNTRLFKKE